MKTTKKKTARKKPAKKKAPARKQIRKASRKTPKLRPYVQPKTAAELGITCATLVDGEKCGKPVLWFDYAIGEKDHMRGFVCDSHRASNRVERLAAKEMVG